MMSRGAQYCHQLGTGGVCGGGGGEGGESI